MSSGCWNDVFKTKRMCCTHRTYLASQHITLSHTAFTHYTHSIHALHTLHSRITHTQEEQEAPNTNPFAWDAVGQLYVCLACQCVVYLAAALLVDTHALPRSLANAWQRLMGTRTEVPVGLRRKRGDVEAPLLDGAEGSVEGAAGCVGGEGEDGGGEGEDPDVAAERLRVQHGMRILLLLMMMIIMVIGRIVYVSNAALACAPINCASTC